MAKTLQHLILLPFCFVCFLHIPVVCLIPLTCFWFASAALAPHKPKSPKDATKQAPKKSPRSSPSKKNASRKTSKALNPKKSNTGKKKDSLKTIDSPEKDDSPKKKSLVKKILDKSGLSLTVEAAIASDDAGQFPACSQSEEEVKSGVKSAWNAYCTVRLVYGQILHTTSAPLYALS